MDYVRLQLNLVPPPPQKPVCFYPSPRIPLLYNSMYFMDDHYQQEEVRQVHESQNTESLYY